MYALNFIVHPNITSPSTENLGRIYNVSATFSKRQIVKSNFVKGNENILVSHLCNVIEL